MYREDEETFEIDPHELEKSRRQKRIKGKKSKKKQEGHWSEQPKKKPKGSYNRHHEKATLRDLMRNYQ